MKQHLNLLKVELILFSVIILAWPQFMFLVNIVAWHQSDIMAFSLLLLKLILVPCLLVFSLYLGKNSFACAIGALDYYFFKNTRQNGPFWINCY